MSACTALAGKTAVVTGGASGKLYIVTHPEAWPAVEVRHQGIAAAFAPQKSPI